MKKLFIFIMCLGLLATGSIAFANEYLYPPENLNDCYWQRVGSPSHNVTPGHPYFNSDGVECYVCWDRVLCDPHDGCRWYIPVSFIGGGYKTITLNGEEIKYSNYVILFDISCLDGFAQYASMWIALYLDGEFVKQLDVKYEWKDVPHDETSITYLHDQVRKKSCGGGYKRRYLEDY